MPAPPTKTSSQTPIINRDADEYLGRIAKRTLVQLCVMMVVVTGIMAYPNAQGSPGFKYRQYIDLLGSLLVVIPFYMGTTKLYAERLRIGRELAEKGEHRQAISALEPFTAPGHRFLDRTGEGHFLLAKSYAATAQKDLADRCREFVIKKRPGVWADRLKNVATQAPIRISQVKGQDNKPRPAKSKAKRRF